MGEITNPVASKIAGLSFDQTEVTLAERPDRTSERRSESIFAAFESTDSANHVKWHIHWLRYCAVVAASVAVLLFAVAGINAFIDPFGIYRLWDIEGVNAYMPAIYHRVRLFKAYEVGRVQPQTIILGSSRSHLGFRCSHEALAHLDGPCYNLAFDGATTREMFEYLQHAHAIRPLKHVVLGLDAYHLIDATSFTRPDFDPLVLLQPHEFRAVRFVTGDLRLLTSFDTLRASIDTMEKQKEAQQNWFSPDGQRIGKIFFRQVEKNFLEFGPRAYFDEIDRLEVAFQTEGMAPRPGSQPAAAVVDPTQSNFAYIKRIVDFCVAKKIDLRILITPAHAHQYEIARAVGASSSIENGKRRLVRLLSDVAGAHPEQPALSVWDFSGYSSITTEPLPPLGSRDEMRFYWDSSHFKEVVGDYVLDRLFSVFAAGQVVPQDFGVQLTLRSIEPALARERAEQEAYRVSHSEDVAHLRNLVNRAIGGD